MAEVWKEGIFANKYLSSEYDEQYWTQLFQSGNFSYFVFVLIYIRQNVESGAFSFIKALINNQNNVQLIDFCFRNYFVSFSDENIQEHTRRYIEKCERKKTIQIDENVKKYVLSLIEYLDKIK